MSTLDSFSNENSTVRSTQSRPETVIGLDFGTSTTLVALPGIEPRILPIGVEAGAVWMPSVLALDGEGNFLTGENADRGAIAKQFRSLKSAITLNKEVQHNAAGDVLDADEGIKKLLTEVRRRCLENGVPQNARVRLSCPAMWTGEQRRRLARLVTEVGFATDVDEILDEPISASISWWWSRFSQGLRIESKKRAVTFDLGGGTLDVAVVEMYPNPSGPEITVLAARGIDIAGDRLDSALATHLLERLNREHNFDLQSVKEPQVVERAILLAARKCKEILSSVEQTTFETDSHIATVPRLEVSRVELNDVFSPLMQSAKHCVEAAIREARLKGSENISGTQIASIPLQDLAGDIDYIVLAGGMCQIPKVSADLQLMMPNAQVEFATADSSRSTAAIVLGTANQNEFQGLNIHRPNLDFVLHYHDRNGVEYHEVLYPAFTPLYDSAAIQRGDSYLGFSRLWKPPFFLKDNLVKLSIKTLSGEDIQLVDSKSRNNFSQEFNVNRYSGLMFKLYVNGKIVLRSSTEEIKVRVVSWPHSRWSKSSLDREIAAIDLNSVDWNAIGRDDSWRDW